MPSCASIKDLATPYVDGELGHPDREAVAEHLRICPPCRAFVATEQAVRDLLRERRPMLQGDCAPPMLRARCARSANVVHAPPTQTAIRSGPFVMWRTRLAPLAVAAMFVLVVGGAFLYQATASSSRVMAAQLAADHVKCFAMNAVLRTHQSSAAVQKSMASGFDWTTELPGDSPPEGLELVGSRPCLYGEGKVAHIMYRHNGRPVSLFMLPRSARAEQTLEVLGHQCAIWSVDDRTFVLVSRETRPEVERLAAFVQAAMH